MNIPRPETITYGTMSPELKSRTANNIEALARCEAYAITSAGNFFLGRPLSQVNLANQVLLRWDDLDLPEETTVERMLYLVDACLLEEQKANIVCSQFQPRLIISKE